MRPDVKIKRIAPSWFVFLWPLIFQAALLLYVTLLHIPQRHCATVLVLKLSKCMFGGWLTFCKRKPAHISLSLSVLSSLNTVFLCLQCFSRCLPACLKKAMADKFKQFSEYQLAKYNTRKHRCKHNRNRPKGKVPSSLVTLFLLAVISEFLSSESFCLSWKNSRNPHTISCLESKWIEVLCGSCFVAINSAETSRCGCTSWCVSPVFSPSLHALPSIFFPPETNR